VAPPHLGWQWERLGRFHNGKNLLIWLIAGLPRVESSLSETTSAYYNTAGHVIDGARGARGI